MGKAYLILENGRVFEGERHGATGEPLGELVFTTGMAEDLATLTDPNHFGQIVVGTFPLAGNCGSIVGDMESDRPHLSGYVVRSLCEAPSNFRSEGILEDWLTEQGVSVLTGVDTRQLTRIIRESGVMNAMISDSPAPDEADLAYMQEYAVTGAVSAVTAEKTTFEGAGRRILLWDFGAKRSLKAGFLDRGCEVVTVPAATPAAELLAFDPAGIVLSGGPGDPGENAGIIRQIRFLFDTGIPIFGTGLGHQMMALAAGGRVRRMKYGHRGANQPARDTKTGRVLITAQNHGYCVVGESLKNGATLRYVNANDGTCEGVDYESFPGFSVQFRPDGAALDRFIAMTEGDAHAQR